MIAVYKYIMGVNTGEGEAKGQCCHKNKWELTGYE